MKIFMNEFHPLTNFEIHKYDQDQLKFDFAYCKNKWQKTKQRAGIINLN